jgi:hypothetical protein
LNRPTWSNGLVQNGHGENVEGGFLDIMAGSWLEIRYAFINLPANSEALNSTPNANQERSNFFIALERQPFEQVSTACDEEAGLLQKLMLAGKPRDTLTEARSSGQ